MTIEEIKIWRERIKTHGLGMAEGKPVVGVIDTLLAEVEEAKRLFAGCNEARSQAVKEAVYNKDMWDGSARRVQLLECNLTIATVALEEILSETEDSNTISYARTALERIKE